MKLTTTQVANVTRRCRFSPYRKGCGPTFALTMWDTGRRDELGKSVLGYRLTTNGAVLFSGEDYHCSPLDCIDSDACVGSLMGFLTLRKGDTDAEYFANYTPEQLAFCDEHAEALSLCVTDRFGEC